ncbi:hypothetical protein B0T25DRAFT_32153 [Lasiosphaeria hispida]|uniref:G domain-containing protein n=1 Tax=Lasiosphaeria hispida TaxID=260671 RepID=A0AAJ0HUJ9_9PEZI|nr:hypothetical protein B0T25DRAFT_32153 [Lasiosphaeria hispida]
MQKPDFVVLLLGATRSGKTAFLKCLDQKKADDGARTTECGVYDVKLSGKAFKIIDTPGLDDSPKANLAVLKIIAEKLAEISGELTVNGVIYFHCITDLRLTGSARTNISILESICGEDFYSQVAFVTTMWNRIHTDEVPRHEKLHRNLGAKYPHLAESGKSFQFSNSHASAEEVLKDFADRVPANPKKPLQLEDEVRRWGPKASSVRKTKAGKLITRDTDRGFCTIL